MKLTVIGACVHDLVGTEYQSGNGRRRLRGSLPKISERAIQFSIYRCGGEGKNRRKVSGGEQLRKSKCVQKTYEVQEINERRILNVMHIQDYRQYE